MSHIRSLLLGAVVLMLSVAAFVVIRLSNSQPTTNNQHAGTKTVKALQTGLEVRRSSSLIEQPVKNDNNQLWKFIQPATSQEYFAISAYYEQGASIRKLTSITRLSLKEAVLENVQLQLPKQYPKYKKQNQKSRTLNGIETTEIGFVYESRGIKIKQRLTLLFKNSDTVVYIRAQALEKDFDEVNNKFIEPILKSARFN